MLSDNEARTKAGFYWITTCLCLLYLLAMQILRAIHSLWSPPVTQALPAEIKAAMAMSDAEGAALLGEANSKLPKGALTLSELSQIDMHKEGYAESNENDIRNWLKGIRDSG